VGLEQPAHVRVPQAGDHAAQAGAVSRVGAVRVALFVGERVVLAVVRHPVDHAALQRHRAEDRQRVAQPWARLEGAVREQAVEADGDAQRGQQVHDGEYRQVAHAQEAVPQEHRRRDHAEERDDDCGDVGVALQAGHCRICTPARTDGYTNRSANPPRGG
jgi:hypothetical protein